VRIARESIDIYAPLADRLGMGQLKVEIEDLSFRYVDPELYARVDHMMSSRTKEIARHMLKLKRFLADELKKSGLEVITIEGRRKHHYSVYKKLVKQDWEIDKIYDFTAVRVIVPSVEDCYKTLGVIHQHFKPLIYRIKDYIAVPKPNGYRSLHTTVFGLDGKIAEIQIRTPEMHEEAEKGLSAHFFYDMHKANIGYAQRKASYLPASLTWVNGLAEVHKSLTAGEEFVDSLKLDLFRDRIFVFTPKGDLFDLPEGATPIDFAFAIHSDIGLRLMGARVNGRMVNLETRLENRDVAMS
jgi:GTP pyrophosphokinase